MKILAIETSCDETAAAIVENGRTVLSSQILSQIDEHKLYGGVVPEIASRRHIEGISYVTKSAFAKSGLSVSDIDAIAVTAAPGLIGALLVGLNFAKALSYSEDLPLIPVHHIRGHVASNYIAHPHLKPPFISLIVSGGHSHIVEVLDYTVFNVIGRTRDDAAGEAFDKVARVLGYPYPGGRYIDSAAKLGNSDTYKLPYPHLDTPYDFSFSGIKTAVVNLVHNLEQKGEEIIKEDLAASFQSTVTQILTDNIIKAATDKGYSSIAIAGGVAANSALREKLKIATDKLGLKLFAPPLSLCGDNGAMIGAQGYYEYKAGHIAALDLNSYATFPMENNF